MPRPFNIWTQDDELLALPSGHVTLSPTQQKVADNLLEAAHAGQVCLLEGGEGMGKTTILRWLHARLGGIFVAARHWAVGLPRSNREPNTLTFVDDLHLVQPVQNASSIRVVFSAIHGHASANAATHAIKAFQAKDYSVICGRYLGDSTDRLDMRAIHKRAPHLSAQQLRNASLRLSLQDAPPSTAAFLECL